MHLKQAGVAFCRGTRHPGGQQFNQTVGLVGIVGCTTGDQGTLVAQGGWHIGVVENILDQFLSLAVPFTERQSPGGSKA